MNILVIDVGTSSIRGVLFDPKGTVLFTHQILYSVNYVSTELAEQSPDDWEATVLQICTAAADWCRENGSHVDGLSLTCQRSSIIPVDQNGKALCNVIMWQDKRNAAIVNELRPMEGFIYERTGARLNTVFSGTKMAWVRRNAPEIYQKTYKFCTIADFIVHNVTGEYRTDHTYGSRSLLMDLRKREWNDELLKLFEVEREKLCDLVEPGSVIGRVTESFAAATGLKAGLPFISGGGDQQCAALGHGVLENGVMEFTLGTGAFALCACDQVPENLSNNVICGAHAVPGQYVLESSMLTCAALYNWGRKTFFRDLTDESLTAINAAVQSSTPGAGGCLALPYFQGRGTPDWNASAKGAFLNLGLGTTPGDMSRAILEGIAMEARNNLDILDGYAGVRKIYIGGGLTKFDTFNQMQADIYGKQLLRNETSQEQSALGAWVNAAATMGLYPNVAEALASANANDQFRSYSPNLNLAPIYEAKRAQMNDTYRVLYGV